MEGSKVGITPCNDATIPPNFLTFSTLKLRYKNFDNLLALWRIASFDFASSNFPHHPKAIFAFQAHQIIYILDVLAVQKVLSGSGRATRRWPMYFPIRRSLPALPEADNTFWTASTGPLFILKWHFLPPLPELLSSSWQCETTLIVTSAH